MFNVTWGGITRGLPDVFSFLNVLKPRLLVKVHREQMAGIIMQQWIEAHRDATGQMGAQDVLQQGQMLAFRAFTVRFITDAGNPLMLACRRITIGRMAGPVSCVQPMSPIDIAESKKHLRNTKI